MGPFGFGNLGDAATQDAVIAQLRARLPHARLVGVSMQPADTQRRHGIETYCYDTSALQDAKRARRPEAPPRRPLHWRLQPIMTWVRELEHAWYVFRALRGIDVLVVSGSGQLDETWGGPWRHPLTIFKWALLARLRGVRVAFLSVGAGTVDSKESRRLLRWALTLAHYCSFRDKGSRDIVRSALGVDRWQAIVPDMAFALPVAPHGGRPGRPDRPLSVALGVLPYFHPRIWPHRSAAKYEDYLRLTADFCRYLVAQGHQVRLVVGEVDHDRVVIDDILQRLGTVREGEALKAPSITSVAELMDEFAGADLVVSSRFHGVLLPLLLCRPVLALSYERKVRQLMDDLSEAGHCLELEGLTLGPLCQAFERLLLERDAVEENLAARVPAQTTQVLTQFDAFAADLPDACRLHSPIPLTDTLP